MMEIQMIASPLRSAVGFNLMVWGLLLLPWALVLVGRLLHKGQLDTPDPSGAPAARFTAWVSCTTPLLLYLLLETINQPDPTLTIGLVCLGGLASLVGFAACTAFLRGWERVGSVLSCALSLAILCLTLFAANAAA